jgi:hypothetical protein
MDICERISRRLQDLLCLLDVPRIKGVSDAESIESKRTNI